MYDLVDFEMEEPVGWDEFNCMVMEDVALPLSAPIESEGIAAALKPAGALFMFISIM